MEGSFVYPRGRTTLYSNILFLQVSDVSIQNVLAESRIMARDLVSSGTVHYRVRQEKVEVIVRHNIHMCNYLALIKGFVV